MAQNLNVLSGYLFDFNAINSKKEWGETRWRRSKY